MSERYRLTSCQFIAIFRKKRFLSFQATKVLIESFVYSNFNCPLVWHCKAKSLQKTENIQQWTWQNLHDNFESAYSELLQKSNKTNMKTQRV